MIYIYPYKLFSQGARELARALRIKRIRQNGTYRPRMADMVINWGNPRAPRWGRPVRILNSPQAVQHAIDKLRTFELFDRHNIPHPPVTRSRREAERWFDTGKQVRVLCRTTARGHGGVGIHLANSPAELREAVAFVRYIPKSNEYRIHVVNGQVIDRQEKRRSRETYRKGEGREYIRSHHNGWIFAREGITRRPEVDNAAIAAIRAVGLDFGAVDIGWHQKFGTQVYEVNSAPGIEGTTVLSYANAFRRYP